VHPGIWWLLTYKTQIVKQRALPMKAMMLSKEGKTMAMMRKRRMVKMRMAIFRKPLNVAERPTMAEFSERACWWMPLRTSRVEMIGLALRGTESRESAVVVLGMQEDLCRGSEVKSSPNRVSTSGPKG
jgi:hypothetical protein